MNPTNADKAVIANWLTRLMAVTRQSTENPIDDEALADYAEMLAADYPVAVFNTASLRAVASGNEWFPAYERIRRALADHIKSLAPTTQSDDPALETWQRYWNRRRAEIKALEDQSKLEFEKARLISFMRQRCPEHVWRKLSGERPGGDAQPAMLEACAQIASATACSMKRGLGSVSAGHT
jgi:hypothetical protein